MEGRKETHNIRKTTEKMVVKRINRIVRGTILNRKVIISGTWTNLSDTVKYGKEVQSFRYGKEVN